jgi:hypothetical protein
MSILRGRREGQKASTVNSANSIGAFLVPVEKYI